MHRLGLSLDQTTKYMTVSHQKLHLAIYHRPHQKPNNLSQFDRFDREISPCRAHNKTQKTVERD